MLWHEVYEKISGAGTVERVTEPLIRADTADQVARERPRAQGEAKRASAGADDALTQSREGLAAAEKTLATARA